MTKIGKRPPGVFDRMDGALPKTREDERDRAAKFVLSHARDAADATLLLDALGIDPRTIGTEVAVTVKLPKSTPRRRFK
jgi:hypothetical protein